MFIEHLDGKFVGHIRDIETFAALELIKAGRAKRAFVDPPAEPAAAIETKPGRKKNAR